MLDKVIWLRDSPLYNNVNSQHSMRMCIILHIRLYNNKSINKDIHRDRIDVKQCYYLVNGDPKFCASNYYIFMFLRVQNISRQNVRLSYSATEYLVLLSLAMYYYNSSDYLISISSNVIFGTYIHIGIIYIQIIIQDVYRFIDHLTDRIP